MPDKHPDHDLRRTGTYATVADVAARWGQTPSDAEAALIDIRLGDVERMILRKIPALAQEVTAGRISRADVVQVEAEVVLRLMRNPEGFVSETDGDYSYQRAKELSTGRLNILDEEFEALGFRRSRMSILVPEPMVETFTDVTVDLDKAKPLDFVVENEAALLPHPVMSIAVTRTDRQLWLYDPSSVKANPAGWVKVGGDATGVQDGLRQGQLLVWDATLDRWVPGRDTVSSGDGYTLVWSNRTQQWVVNANRLQDLTDVHASNRHAGGPVQTGDMLQFDDVSGSWVVVEPSAFLNHMVLSTTAVGDIIIFDGTNWVNTQGYTKADVDQKLSNVVSGLARKPAVQNIQDVPPTTPVVGQNYIVGKTPTGAWLGHVDAVTFFDGANWIFEVPTKGDTHTNLTTNQAMTWNATDWVSLGSQAAALKDLSGVRLTIPVATDDVLTFDGADWVNRPVTAPDMALDDLIDVDVFSVVGGDVLTFDDATGQWGPGLPSASALDDLTDVAVPAPIAGDILSYDTISGSWIGRQPSLANPSLDGLADVNAGSPDNGDVLVFDGGEWIAQPVVVPTKLTDLDVGAPSDGDSLIFDSAADGWISTPLSVSGLSDVDPNDPADGQVLVWDDDTQRWTPSTPKSQLSLLTDVVAPTPVDGDVLMFDPTQVKWVNHHVELRGLGDVDVVASAPTYGQSLVFDGTRWANHSSSLGELLDVDLTIPPAASNALVFDAGALMWQAQALALNSLTDVLTTAPADGQILQYEAATTTFKNVNPALTPANVYTKPEIDAKVTTLVTGLEHGVAVQAILNDPPTAPVVDEVYIVGITPTGLWTGHSNEITYWNGTAWVFAAPQANETHMVEVDTATWNWNGTAWVKVAAATTAAASVSSLSMVGEIKQSILTETQFTNLLPVAERHNWVLADGRNVAGTRYAAITGQNTVPDLRGAFLRMAGQNAANTSWNGGTLGGWQEDATRLPRTAFTGTTSSDGSHHHGMTLGSVGSHTGWTLGESRPGVNNPSQLTSGSDHITGDAGAHSHTVTINGGGDTETRPKNYGVNYYIRVD